MQVIAGNRLASLVPKPVFFSGGGVDPLKFIFPPKFEFIKVFSESQNCPNFLGVDML